jgi:hypothetical protein
VSVCVSFLLSLLGSDSVKTLPRQRIQRNNRRIDRRVVFCAVHVVGQESRPFLELYFSNVSLGTHRRYDVASSSDVLNTRRSSTWEIGDRASSCQFASVCCFLLKQSRVRCFDTGLYSVVFYPRFPVSLLLRDVSWWIGSNDWLGGRGGVRARRRRVGVFYCIIHEGNGCCCKGVCLPLGILSLLYTPLGGWWWWCSVTDARVCGRCVLINRYQRRNP